MPNEILIKEIPKFIIYYRDEVISEFNKISEFAFKTRIKCVIPNYSYINYLDGEYKEKDIKMQVFYSLKVEKTLKNYMNIEYVNNFIFTQNYLHTQAIC